ncbi:diguanylate cyclase domain-containing protein [Legionella tunisiensis]|uniref:diguanylate cyclase domain-containing protein n=1 Tax=Legionella tunisiensis TaxID=1034944 RepID=UPI0009FCCC1A
MRRGWDEFAILLSNFKNNKDVEKIAQKIVGRFKKPFELDNHSFYATVSVGVAISDHTHKDFLL